MSKESFTLEDFNRAVDNTMNKFDNIIVLGIDPPLVSNEKKINMSDAKRVLNAENYQNYPLIIVDCDEFLEQATMCGPKLNFIIVEGQENESRREDKDYIKIREDLFSKCKRAQQTRANIKNYTTVINFIKLSKPKKEREVEVEDIKIGILAKEDEVEGNKDEQ